MVHRGRRRKRTYRRSSVSGVASLATTVLSVLKGRRTSRRSKTRDDIYRDRHIALQTLGKLHHVATLPLGVRWGDMEL